MTRAFAVLFALLAASATIAAETPIPAAGGPAPPAAASPESADAALREYERLGRDLYRADRAAWLTTDLLVAQGIVRGGKVQDVDGEPDGWVTSPMPGSDIWRVAYVARQPDGTAVSFADGTVDFSGAEPLASLRRNTPVRGLDDDEGLQRSIAGDAAGRGFLFCGNRPYNRAILPDGRGGWHVYLMPPQPSARVLPLGGFHRVAYDGHGAFVSQYAHTRGCLEADLDATPPGSEPLDMLMVSHLTTPTPNEFHVFMNLAYGMPVMVSTSAGLWKVADGRIATLDAGDDE